MNLLQALLKSKKLQVTIVGIIITLFHDKLGVDIDPETVNEIITILSAYVIGQGFADMGKNK